MKKLLTILAAAATVFGFASCAGDLHDVVKSPIDLTKGYHLVGSMQGWNEKSPIALEASTETTGAYEVKFQADAADIYFAFIPTVGKWDGQIGGDKMVGGTLPTNASYKSADNGNGGFNAVVSGLEAKGNYLMTVTAQDDGTLKIDVKSNVPPTPFYLQNMYVRGGMIDWSPSVAGSLKYSSLDVAKGIVTYTVDFLCSDVSADDFGIVDGSSNWAVKYTGATIAVDGAYVATTKGAGANNKITGLEAGKNYRIFIQTNPDETVSVKVATLVSYKIKGCKLLNYTAEVKDEGGIWFLEGWVPDNEWNETSPNKAVKSGSDYVRTFASEVAAAELETSLASAFYHIQIVNWDGVSSGSFWSNKVTGGSDAYCNNVKDGKAYWLVYDAGTDDCSLVED